MRNDTRLGRWKDAIWEKYDFTCVFGCDSTEIHAHHILEKSIYPKYKYVLENGILLCKECHQKIHWNGDNMKQTPLRKRSKKRGIIEAHDKRWRESVLKRCGKYCASCGGSYDIEVHHIIGKKSHPGYRHVLENGIPLCWNCHRNIHNSVEFKDEIYTELGLYEWIDMIKSGDECTVVE